VTSLGPVTEQSHPTASDIEAARERIAGQVWQTPAERSGWLSTASGTEVHLKFECWQRTGSFKVRGAFNAVAEIERKRSASGIVTASAGNHGQAVALAASRAGIRCRVFVPAAAPEAKKARIRDFGAELDDSYTSYDDAEDAAIAHAKARRLYFLHGFSDRAVVAGQGTVGLEILDQVPEVRTIVVPVGGGGLVSGIGIAVAGRGIRVAGVQSELTRNMHAALEAGGVVDVPVVPTLADGLAGRTDAISLDRVGRWVDGVSLVSESAIEDAIRGLFANHGAVAEGAGAVGVAALLAGVIAVEGPAVIVVSGRNIDPDRLARILKS
jgi:threonine dehydratase